MSAKVDPAHRRMGSKAIDSTTPTVRLIFILIPSMEPTLFISLCSSQILYGKKTT